MPRDAANCEQANRYPPTGVQFDMRNSPIVLGDAVSVLERGPAPMQRVGDWQQRDSDQFAHFVQVNKQISESRWSSSEVSFSKSGDTFTGGTFPDIESFVYVAVYFRQLFGRPRSDRLFNKVCDRYVHFVGNPGKCAWLAEERRRFNDKLNQPFFMLQGYSVEQLIEAFLYGASILHGIPHDQCENKKHFHEIISNHDRERVLFSLHGSLKMLQNHVSRVAAVIYQDFSNWINSHNLPLPDVIWHFSLFQPPKAS